MSCTQVGAGYIGRFSIPADAPLLSGQLVRGSYTLTTQDGIAVVDNNQLLTRVQLTVQYRSVQMVWGYGDIGGGMGTLGGVWGHWGRGVWWNDTLGEMLMGIWVWGCIGFLCVYVCFSCCVCFLLCVCVCVFHVCHCHAQCPLSQCPLSQCSLSFFTLSHAQHAIRTIPCTPT